MAKKYRIKQKIDINGTLEDISLNKTIVGLENVDNTSDLNKPISTAVQKEIDNIKNEKGIPNGLATLGSDGKIPSEQLPELSGGGGTVDKITVLKALGITDKDLQTLISLLSKTTVVSNEISFNSDIVANSYDIK